MFVPSNVPVLLLPFLVVIEVISHIAKIFSLAIRLFANMMSGHVLLHILTGFLVKLGQKNFLFAFFPTLLIASITLLEYGITFLQAYVFVTLLAIYFEEHFGFAEEEKNIVSKIIIANGRPLSSFKTTYMLLFKYYYVDYKKDINLVFIDRREKHRIKRKNYWELSVICIYLPMKISNNG